ncbi:phosphogluconate dehydratase [Aliikangiella sp. G2MR2-5]|uniref:phosphogluconate dehydratase n=1 Tax=Aliikangiella sp. G2MR2-5 TaxID=2788943 RepID=UPI0018A8B245|nr:phosphogluconate dehydratase [Aliikangiella sp. G2MR2-5]
MTVIEPIEKVTRRIIERSRVTREAYVCRMQAAAQQKPARNLLSCGNLAHGMATCSQSDKALMAGESVPNLGIVTSYNDMLSAHHPYEHYPQLIKAVARRHGITAQVAGGVPAMCDGVTQGQAGMELSLFSRDLIAMATAVSLSHAMFDGVICLGVCDKIVPGLLIGALSFGHLPTIFLPAGPMSTGQSNSEKAKVRQLYAEGKVGRKELLESESASYHGAGTCTFYGTANSNQMLMEIMGLHLPGSSFVPPQGKLREQLTVAGVERLIQLCDSRNKESYKQIPLYQIVTEKSLVNGIIGLLATGGSTNHAIHLVAIAKAAGIQIDWQDMAELSACVPLLCRIYPNGSADVNQFHAAGGMGFLMQSLLQGGYLHEDVTTIMGEGLESYTFEPKLSCNNRREIFRESGETQLSESQIDWQKVPQKSLDESIIRNATNPFSEQGGLKLLTGNIGRAVIKVSAVAEEHQVIEAPAKVFESQEDFQTAFEQGLLNQHFIAVIRFQGPKTNGMPELHKLTPLLGVLQDKGFKVALVTDGRMSGASGKVPAAIHLTPEASDCGVIAKIQDGDMLLLDAQNGCLSVAVSEQELLARHAVVKTSDNNQFGMGRELFSAFRGVVSGAESGATIFSN